MRTGGFALVLFAAAAVGQDKLVTFEAAIGDAHGRPVKDINTDELQLQDNGKHFKIVVFHAHERKADTGEAVANQYSNSSLSAPSATALVLDFVNTSVAQQGYVRGRFVEAVEHLRASGYLLLATITARGPAWVEDFPAWPALQPDNSWTGKIATLLENAPPLTTVNTADRGEFTYQCLDKIAQSFSRFPGQKKVVWISEGVPREQRGPVYFLPIVHRISSSFAARGITLFTASGFASGMRTLVSSNSDMLTPIAEGTGGKAFLDRDIAGAIAAEPGPSVTYTIGFYPEEWDGKKHKLALTCTRRGSEVRAPDSYVADADQWTPTARERQAISRALGDPFDLDGIGLRAAVGPSKTPGALQLQIRIAAEDLRLLHQEAGYTGHLSTTIAYYEASGARKVFNGAERQFHFTDEQRQAALRAGIGLTDERQIPATVTGIRIIAFDP